MRGEWVQEMNRREKQKKERELEIFVWNIQKRQPKIIGVENEQ